MFTPAFSVFKGYKNVSYFTFNVKMTAEKKNREHFKGRKVNEDKKRPFYF
jgi:hypothetical protein